MSCLFAIGRHTTRTRRAEKCAAMPHHTLIGPTFTPFAASLPDSEQHVLPCAELYHVVSVKRKIASDPKYVEITNHS